MIFHAKKKNINQGACSVNIILFTLITLIKHFSIAVLFAAYIEDVIYEYKFGWTVYALQALCLSHVVVLI